MTKSESAQITAQTVLLESAEQVLQLRSAAGVRLAIPDTNNLIMVGTADWIAANVPGVGVVVAGALTDEQIVEVARAAYASHRLSWLGFDKDKHGRYTVPTLSKSHYDLARAVERATIARLAATTQASTAQAEPGIVSALSAALDHAREALRFYAEQQHFHMHQPGEWDTVSGEPQNYYEDCNNTATVEDGSVAKQALEDIAFTGRIAAATSSTDAQAAPTDISRQVRQIAEAFDKGGQYYRVMQAAAEEIERYYGGMMAWKRTAEAKDADAQAAAEVREGCEHCIGTYCLLGEKCSHCGHEAESQGIKRSAGDTGGQS